MNITSTIKLNNGVRMPLLGLGTFRSAEGEEVYRAVSAALEAGYRLIDTASVYGNEAGVGRAIASSGIPREELFITTKLWNDDQRSGSRRQALEASLTRLGLDYLDLYLIHWPVPGKYVGSWRCLESFYDEKLCRAVGVSNFNVRHLQDVLGCCSVVPAVNQIECHPYLAQAELAEFCFAHGIQPELWSPLGAGRVLQDKTLAAIGLAHGKSVSQIALRWELQRGFVTIPKSSRRDRIIENSEVFDFELSSDEMSAIAALDRGERVGADPETFDF